MGRDDRSQAERVYLLAQHLGRRLRALDGEMGLSPARFSALAGLAFHGPMNLCELAEFEGVRPPSMTRLVRDMGAAGLVRRRPDPGDGRGVRVELSAAGRAAVGRARRRKVAWVARRLAGAGAADRRALDRALALLEPLAEPGAR
jgi:DNA-binding MarR family transcriptional regulator